MEELRILPNDFITVQALSPPELFYLDHSKINRKNIQWTQSFVGVLNKSAILKMDSKEATEIKWVEASEAPTWISYCKERGVDCRSCSDSSNITVTTKSNANQPAISVPYETYGDLMKSRLGGLNSRSNQDGDRDYRFLKMSRQGFENVKIKSLNRDIVKNRDKS